MQETPLFGGDERLVALVCDTSLDLDVPHFDLDDIKALADFVEKRFLSGR